MFIWFSSKRLTKFMAFWLVGATALLCQMAQSTAGFPNPGDAIGSNQRYLLEAVLLKRESWSIYRAKDVVNNRTVAVRIVSMDNATPQIKKYVETETKVHSVVDHPNITKLFANWGDGKFVYIVSEFCSGGTLYDEMKKGKNGVFRNETYMRKHMREVLNLLKYFKSQRIVFRNLSPYSLFFCSVENDKVLKVADFGFSEIFNSANYRIVPSSNALYTAPELYTVKAPYQADMWDAGIVLFGMLTEGRHPFVGKDVSDTQKRAIKGEFNLPKFVSKSAQDLIAKMLAVDPSNRISIDTIESHAWFESTEVLYYDGNDLEDQPALYHR